MTLRLLLLVSARVRPYFEGAAFLAWDDVAPPVFHVSADGTMAYAVVQKRVRLTAPDSTGATREEHVVFAWLETWEKVDGAWHVTAVASTDRPAYSISHLH